MKKTVLIMLCAVLFAANAGAQTPQIAYRLLDDYIDKQQEKAEKGRVAKGITGIVIGGLLIGAGAATWIYGDEAYAHMSNGGTLNPSLKAGMAVGIAAGGGFCVWGGIETLTSRPKDLRLRYASVYEEDDPEVQEAMAAATIRDMAGTGRGKRIGSIVTKLSVATLCIAINIGGNLASGRGWDEDLTGVLLWQSGSIGSAIGDIFTKSEGELLYEKYLAAREALYSSPSYGEGTKIGSGRGKGEEGGEPSEGE